MFGKILEMRLTRWVASYLLAAITLTLTYGDGAGTALAQKAAQKKITIAAVGIENLTKSNILADNFGIDMLLAELSDVEDCDLMARAKIVEAMRGLKPNPDVAISVGEAVGADAVVVGFVSDIKYSGTEQAQVEVGLSMYSVAEGHLLSEAVVVGRVARLGFSGTMEQLAEMAVRDGVRNAVGFLFENMSKFGVVTMLKGNKVYTNLAQRDNVRVGAEIAIMRGDRQVASIEIDEVSIAHSVGKIIEQKKGVSIKAGDRARLVYTPAVYEELTGGIKKVPEKKKLSPLVIGLLAVGVVAAVSRGGSKAESPQAQLGPSSVASADNKAVVYSPTPFNVDYIPGAPIKITNPASDAGLMSCWNSSASIVPINTVAYEFFLSTTTKDSTLPGNGYTLVFDMTNIAFEDSSKLSCATCNTDFGTWEVLDSTYGRHAAIGNRYGVSCNVTHFTPYVVVNDNRVSPLPRPSNFKAQCGDGSVGLYWQALESTSATGYKIYDCSPTSCSTVKTTIIGRNVESYELTNMTNDQQVCYAIQGVSNNQEQDALISPIQCAIPSADPEVCKIEDITLISPANNSSIQNSKPSLIFTGSGTMDYYIVTLETTAAMKEVLFSFRQQGEGASSSGARQTYTVAYGGSSLYHNNTYRWRVDGYTNSRGKELASVSWQFTYTGGYVGEECCAITKAPSTISPSNGSDILYSDPTFLWQSDPCARKYVLNVYNQSGASVYFNILDAAANSDPYSGEELLDDMTYYWYVLADNGCSYTSANTAQFTKRAPTEASDLPIPQWVSGSGLQPVLTGDRIVSLEWYEITDPNVIGYRVYRGTSSTSLSTLDTVYKSQLGTSPPSENCPVQFSETKPGYCDISVVNGTEYFYKLASITTGGVPSQQSVSKSARPPLQRPELISPGAVTAKVMTSDDPTFIWFSGNGTASVRYDLQLIDESNNQTVWEPSSISGTSIQYGGPRLEKGKTYRWSVRARNDFIFSEWSTAFKFTKQESIGKPDAPNWCGGAYCSPQQSEPTFPNDSNSSITLYWQKPSSASVERFRIYRCHDVQGEEGYGMGVCTFNVAEVLNTACSPTKTNVVCYEDTYLARGRTYYYYVAAIDEYAEESNPSTPQSVTLLLKGPTIYYPLYDQSIFVPQPEFQWLKENGAEFYHFQLVQKADGFGNPTKYIWNTTLSGDTTSVLYNADGTAKETLKNPTTPSQTGASNEYAWRVCSANSKFPIYTSSCSQSQFIKNLFPPDPVSPGNSEYIAVSGANNITFRWTLTPGAAGYTVRVCSVQGTGDNCTYFPIIWQQNVTANEATMSNVDLNPCNLSGDPTCSLSGTYMWEVRAFDDYGAVSGSWPNVNRRTFYVTGNEAPILTSPANNEIIGPDISAGIVLDPFYSQPTYKYNIDFVCTEMSQHSGYIFRIEAIEASDDALPDGAPPGTASYVTIFQKTISGCYLNSTSENIEFMAGRRYRWNVTVQGTPFNDANSREFITGLPKPRLLAPMHGEQVMMVDDCDGASSTLCLHFDWDGGEVGTQQISGVIGAASYDIEILSNGRPFLCNPQFLYVPENPPDPPRTNTQNTFCDLSTTSVTNGDIFSWRVRARDASGVQTVSGEGYPGDWSPYNSFTVLIPSVVLASPPGNGACDPTLDPTGAGIGNCVSVSCVDASYYWSPIPFALGKSCYRIDVSDTYDFRNIVFTDYSASPMHGTFPCPYQQCFVGSIQDGHYVPMTNGVVYYWRVGASVTPDGGTCGNTWVFSEVWSYLKRPPNPRNVSITAAERAVTIMWDHPSDCTAVTGQALSWPGVPPDRGGGYIIWVDGSRHSITTSNVAVISNLNPDTTYEFCVQTLDNSGNANHLGNVSLNVCQATTTLPETVP